MERRSYKSKPQHLITDPRSGEIKRIIHPSDTDVGSSDVGANLRVFGDISLSGDIKTIDGQTFIAGGPNVTVTTASNGQVTISAVAASGASAALSYVTVAAEAGLTSERVLTGGTGVKIIDGGANSTVTMNIHDSVVATVSGTNFTGVVKATGGISGSIQQTVGGLSYLVGGTNVTITTASNGQITIAAAAASGAPSTAQYLTLATDGTLSAERVLIPSTGLFYTDGGANGNYTIGVNDRFFAALTGSNFTGPTTYSSIATFNGGLSGSLSRLTDGTSFIAAGSNVTITTASNGQITISSTGGGGGGGGGDPNPSYLTLALTASLSNERVFTPGTGLKATDGGANSTYTLNVNDGVVATISGSTFTGAITAASNGGITGSITRLVGGSSPFITVPAGNALSVSTGSGGQIILSSSTTPITSQYLLLSPDANLPAERVFTPGTGLRGTDAGASSTYTLAINNGVVATVSGTTFTGGVTFASNGGATGSITQTTAGTPFITAVAGNVITITTGSNGQVIFSGSGGANIGAPKGAQFLTLATDPELTVERVFTPSTGLKATDGGAGGNYTLTINDGVVATLSGSTFTGAITAAAAGGITGSITKTTAGTPFITAPAGNAITVTTGSNGQVILSASISGGSGAPTTSAYVTIGNDGSLSAERALTAGTGITLTDGGANSTVTLAINNSVVATVSGTTFTGAVTGASNGGFTGSLTVTTAGTPFITAPAGNAISISTGSNGQIVLSGSGGSNQGAPKGAQYLALATDPELTSERVFTPSTGLFVADGGAGGNYTVGVNDRFFAALTGSVFTGVLSASGGISGSIQQVGPGLSYLVGAGGVTITSASNGQITISSSLGAPTTAQYLTLATDATLQTERVFTPSIGLRATDGGANGNYTLQINDGVVATISGSTFTGAITAASAGGITGSITVTTAGTPYITAPAGNVIVVSTGSNGQIILSGSGGTGGSGAPTTSQYLTLATDASLSAERVFTPSTGLKATDGGANGNYTLSVNDSVVATLSGSTFTGAIVAAAAGGITGSITKTTAGTPFITAAAGNVVTISTGSNGQIILSGSGGANQGAPKGAQYITLAVDPELSSERVFTPSTGLKATDGGANGNYTVVVHDGTFAALTGSNFTGAVTVASPGTTATAQGSDVWFYVSGSSNLASGGNRKVALFGGDVVVSGSISAPWISGSIQQLASGISYIVNGSPGSLTITSQSNGQIIFSSSAGGGGGGGAPTTSQYLTLVTDATLTQERVLTPSIGLKATDGGAGGNYTLSVDNGVVATISGSTFTGAITAASNGGITGSITRLVGGNPFITVPAGNAIVVSTGSNGQVILSASISGGSGASVGAQYLQLATDATNTAERVFTPSTGLKATDAGANSTYTLIVHDGTFAALTGSNFTGAVTVSSPGTTATTQGTDVWFYVSGSATKVGGAAVTSANRKVILLSGDLVSSASMTLSGTVSFDSQLRTASTIGTDVQFYVSGSSNLAAGYNRRIAVFGGDVWSSGSISAPWFSGSIQQTQAGLSYLVGGRGMLITSGGNGQITIAGDNRVFATISGSTYTGAVTLAAAGGATGSITVTTAGTPFVTAPAGNVITVSTGSNGQIILSGTTPASGAPLGAQYLTLATDPQLTSERAFTPSTGLKATDAGAGGAYTVVVHDGTFAALTGSNFTGAVTVSSPGTTATTQGTDVWFYVSGSSGVNTGANRKVAVFCDSVFSGTLSVGSLNFSSFATLQVTGSSQTVDIGGQTSVPLQTTNYNNDQNGAFLVQRKARGTPSAPSQILGNDIIGGLIARGFGAGSSYFPTTNAGAMVFIAEADFQTGSNATKFQLRLTPTGSTSTSTVFNMSSEGRASFDPTGTLAATKGTDVFFYVSGSSNTSGTSNRKVALFNGDVLSSGSFQANWFSGSIQKTNAGLSYLVASGAVTITSRSNGQVTIFAAAGGGSIVGSNTQVIFNDGGSAYAGDANFTFRKNDGAVTAVAFTGSFLSASQWLSFGQYMPIATDGYIRCGYPQLNLTTLLATVNSVAVDSPIIRTNGDEHYFGEGGSNIYQGNQHNFYNEAGNSHTYLDYTYFITRCSSAFTTDLTNTASVGSDVYFYVSGSIHGPQAATNADVDPVSVDRHVAVFGTDVHVSGTMRFTVDSALTPTEILKVDNAGVDYNAFTVSNSGSDMQWGNTAFYNTYNGYGVTLNGETAGVSAYDGRNALTTDLAVVSQRLTNIFSTSSLGLSATPFTFTVNDTEIWDIEFYGTISNRNGANGVRFGVMAPTGSNVDGWVQGVGATYQNTNVNQRIRQANSASIVVGATTAANVPTPARLYASVVVNGSGNLGIGVASNVSGQTIDVLSGSFFKARRATAV